MKSAIGIGTLLAYPNPSPSSNPYPNPTPSPSPNPNPTPNPDQARCWPTAWATPSACRSLRTQSTSMRRATGRRPKTVVNSQEYEYVPYTQTSQQSAVSSQQSSSEQRAASIARGRPSPPRRRTLP
eukprot:scaffold95316_cov44-Phaeocystis_antarctica.AAC.2